MGVKIIVKKEDNCWGETYYKPVCGLGKTLIRLTKNKNFTRDNIRVLQEAKFQIELQQQTIDT